MRKRRSLKYHVLFFTLLLTLIAGVTLPWVGNTEWLLGALIFEQGNWQAMRDHFPTVLGLKNITPSSGSIIPPSDTTIHLEFDRLFDRQSLLAIVPFGSQSGRIPCSLSFLSDTVVNCVLQQRLFPGERLLVTLPPRLRDSDLNPFLPPQSSTFDVGSMSREFMPFSFQHAFSWAPDRIPKAMEIADLNQDQSPEILVLFANPFELVIYNWRNNILQVQEHLPVPKGTERFTITDLDHQGELDLVLASKNAQGEAVLRFLFRADQGFEIQKTLSVGTSIQKMMPIDWDVDGNVEIAVLHDQENRLSFYSADVSSREAEESLEGLFSPNDFDVMDYDQNGLPDIILVEKHFPGLRLFFPDDILELALAEIPHMVLSRDFNQDGKPDLIIGFSDHLDWYRVENNTLLFEKNIVSVQELKAIQAFDFDGDRDFDLVVLDQSGLKIFRLDQGAWTLFQHAETIEKGMDLNITDIDQDGIPEIVLLTEKGIIVAREVK